MIRRIGTIVISAALLLSLCGTAQALGVGQGEQSYTYFSFACANWYQDQPDGGDTHASGAGVCVDVYHDAAGNPIYVVSAGRGSCLYDQSSVECEGNSVGGEVPASDVVYDATAGVVSVSTVIRSCRIDVAMALPSDDSGEDNYLSPWAEIRENELRAYYEYDEQYVHRSGTASGDVCGWSEATGPGSAWLEQVGGTDRYVYVDTSPGAPTIG